MPARAKARSVVAAPVLATLALLAICPATGQASRGASQAEKLNLVVVMTDDQALNSFRRRFMPATFRELVGRGTRFRQAAASPPLCCPARAGFLTGQYAHNHGVERNSYALLRHKRHVLPTWLRRAGYETAMFGKHLNGYTEVAGRRPGPGFDRWLAFHGRPSYFNYELSDDGRLRRRGSAPSAYSTRVITERAAGWIRRRAARAKRFFAWVSYYAPHDSVERVRRGCRGQMPRPMHSAAVRRHQDVKAPRPANFGVPDPAGATAKAHDPLDAEQVERIDHRFRCTLAALEEVDRGVERIVRVLERHGRMRDTALVFISDNGFFFGEHAIPRGKGRFYDPAVLAPLAIRLPGSQPRLSDVAVSNVDIAPTLLSLAGGARPCRGPSAPRPRCRRLDGRDLGPLLSGRAPRWSEDRALPFTLGLDCLTYEAIRAPSFSYVRPRPGRVEACPPRAPELYDLAADPLQLENLAGQGLPGETEAESRLEELRSCSGIRGRDRAREAVSFCR